MMIRDMFQDNINRPINGVIKVDQDAANVVEQEVHEYVITTKFKDCSILYFNQEFNAEYYSRRFSCHSNLPTN